MARASLRALWRSMLDFAHDPETSVPDWLHSGVLFGVESTNWDELSVSGGQRPWKHPDCVGWPMEHVGTQNHRNCKSLEEGVGTCQARNYVRKRPSWEAIRLRWPRAVATKLACIVETRRDGPVKIRLVMDFRRSGVNGLTHVP